MLRIFRILLVAENKFVQSGHWWLCSLYKMLWRLLIIEHHKEHRPLNIAFVDKKRPFNRVITSAGRIRPFRVKLLYHHAKSRVRSVTGRSNSLCTFVAVHQGNMVTLFLIALCTEAVALYIKVLALWVLFWTGNVFLGSHRRIADSD